jgi:hypothetical protein
MNIQIETQQTHITNHISSYAIKNKVLFVIMHKSRIMHLFYSINTQKLQFDQNMCGQSKKIIESKCMHTCY